jgi:hypothetical protein
MLVRQFITGKKIRNRINRNIIAGRRRWLIGEMTYKILEVW